MQQRNCFLMLDRRGFVAALLAVSTLIGVLVAGEAAAAAATGAGPPPAQAAAATVPGPIPGQASELYKWYDAAGQGPAGATPAFHCLAQTFLSGPQDKKVFSQVGEDGIIQAVFKCIQTTDRYYVEFGTQTGTECTTRYLRQAHGWTGLLMDGGYQNASINLHKEFLTAENIVSLFEKYKVPQPSFDLLSVDVDLNTAYLMRAVLAGGYRPRLLVAEYNRNFAPSDSYITMYAPGESWAGTCYYGGSGLALERIARAFGYSLVAFDAVGVNVFFVHDSLLGAPFPHSFAQLTRNASAGAWQPLHLPCLQTPWMYVEDSHRLAGPAWMHHLHPVMLNHKDSSQPAARGFYEVDTTLSLVAHPCSRDSRGSSAAGGSAGDEQHQRVVAAGWTEPAARKRAAWDRHRQHRRECRLHWMQQLQQAGVSSD